jgi:acetyltransferase-like isoleucine patch superfamily enzyme
MDRSQCRHDSGTLEPWGLLLRDATLPNCWLEHRQILFDCIGCPFESGQPSARACHQPSHDLPRRTVWDDEDFFAWREANPVRLGHDVWIGHGVTVLPGVSIGNGAAIGAGAVVTKDVPAYTVAVGIPARVLRPRFAEGVAERLERTGWFHWSRELLEARFEDFKNLDVFLEKYD